MKPIKEFVLRSIAGEHLLVPTGKTSQELNGMISLSSVAAEIWKNLEKVNNLDEMVDIVTSEFEVDRETAEKDTKEFIDNLLNAQLITLSNEDKLW